MDSYRYEARKIGSDEWYDCTRSVYLQCLSDVNFESRKIERV